MGKENSQVSYVHNKSCISFLKKCVNLNCANKMEYLSFDKTHGFRMQWGLLYKSTVDVHLNLCYKYFPKLWSLLNFNHMIKAKSELKSWPKTNFVMFFLE